MDVQIIAKKENPLLQRTEVTFKAVHKAEATPTRDALRTELAKQLKATKEHVILDGMASSFGRYETTGYAKVYKSKETALAVERSHILVRNKLKEPEVKEKKEGGGKAEKPAKAEAPKKEEKPEAKPERKPEPKAEHKPEAKAEHKEAVPAKEKKEPEAAEKKEEKHEEKRAEGKPESKKAAPKKKEA